MSYDHYVIHMVSFKNTKEDGHNVLIMGQGQKPSDWQLEKMQEYIDEQKYGDLC